MIKLTQCEPVGDLRLRLAFSDGTCGVWDAADLLSSKRTVLTVPLLNSDYFARAFVDNGALAWPNGLEFAPWTLHERMGAAGLLSRQAA